MMPYVPPPAPAQTDPRLLSLIERNEAALRDATAALSASRPDAIVAMSQQRLTLVTALEALKDQDVLLRTRIDKAEKQLRKSGQSEHERALIAESLLDLAAGRPVERPVPQRVSKREEYKDSVEAYGMLIKNRDTRARIEAQVAAIDRAFAALGTSPSSASTQIQPSGRPIQPAL